MKSEWLEAPERPIERVHQRVDRPVIPREVPSMHQQVRDRAQVIDDERALDDLGVIEPNELVAQRREVQPDDRARKDERRNQPRAVLRVRVKGLQCASRCVLWKAQERDPQGRAPARQTSIATPRSRARGQAYRGCARRTRSPSVRRS